MKKYQISSLFLALVLIFSLCAVPVSALEDPAPNCGAAIVVDGDYGDVLYSHNGYEKMYPASITKVMTSLLVMEALENGTLTPDQPITASETAVVLPEGSSTAGIKAGEILTVEQLLYCDLVSSANEACNILAETVGGSVINFVTMMNEKARELGMYNTHFVNPHGLHDEDHYTTAYDVYLMARAAMEYDLFRTIVSTTKYVVPATNLSDSRTLYTTNALLDNWKIAGYTYSRAIGIKTGSTTPAGQCLVSAAVDDRGRTFYCVVLGAKNEKQEDGSTVRYSFKESKRLLEWAFENFDRKVLLDDTFTEVIREIPVTLSDDTDYVIAHPIGSIEATMPITYDPKDAEYRIELVEGVEAPVEKGTKMGEVTIVYEGEEYGTLDMVAADDVARSEVQYRIKVAKEYLELWWVKAAIIGGAALLLLLILWLCVILPHRRRRRRYSTRSGYRGRR